jgi:hypothetical protein
MTVSIYHTLKLVTEVDENHAVGKQLLGLSHEAQVAMLEGMARELLINNSINEVNAGGSYAFLKVAE